MLTLNARRLARTCAVAIAVAGASAPAAQALTSPRVFWSNSLSNSIGTSSLDGTVVNQDAFAPANHPSGVAVDGRRIYWGSPSLGTIGAASLDGSTIDPSLITGLGSIEGLAVDRRHIYWASATGTAIGRANLDGSDVKQSFIALANHPFGVTVDGRHIYWTNLDINTIGRANIDGSGVDPAFITGPSVPIGIAVDGQHVYWTNFGNDTIGVANLDGTEVNTSLMTGISHPRGLAVDGEHVYWIDDSADRVGRANLDGSGVDLDFVTGLRNAQYVAVSVPVASAGPVGPAFATTPVGSLSPPQALTIKNDGQTDLAVAGVSFEGSDAGDFVVGSTTCLGPVAPGASCQLTVRFSPQAQGPRSATLRISSNDVANGPLDVALSGTGGALPTGPAGAAGPAGAPGPAGPTGPIGAQGLAGKVLLVTCKTVTRTVKRGGRTVRAKRQRCTTRLVSGRVKFTAAGRRATISRAGVTYASGTAVELGHGRLQLVLTPRRTLARGRYTLAVATPKGPRRTHITVG